MTRRVKNEPHYSEPDATVLPSGNYTFSYYSPTLEPTLVRRPWWNLFGKDSIKMVERSTRYTICGIPECEAQLIVSASNEYWNNPIGRLLLRVIDKPVAMVQLEQVHATSPYVSVGVQP